MRHHCVSPFSFPAFPTEAQQGWVDPFAIFHGDVSSFAYADGHADLHKWSEATTVKAARDSSNGKASFYWAGGNVSNVDFRWVHKNYKHTKFVQLDGNR